VEILLRIRKAEFQENTKTREDKAPQSGRDLMLGIDIDLQAYGEYLMQNKIGAIVMIEPRTGEILCMIASPSYDPSLLTGKDFGKNYLELERNPYKPLINRAISGMYPPDQLLNRHRGQFFYKKILLTPKLNLVVTMDIPPIGGRPACHGHPSPLSICRHWLLPATHFFVYGFKRNAQQIEKLFVTRSSFRYLGKLYVEYGLRT
jgi:penicillin-binding protein 2